jgi:hypothetical protein
VSDSAEPQATIKVTWGRTQRGLSFSSDLDEDIPTLLRQVAKFLHDYADRYDSGDERVETVEERPE